MVLLPAAAFGGPPLGSQTDLAAPSSSSLADSAGGRPCSARASLIGAVSTHSLPERTAAARAGTARSSFGGSVSASPTQLLADCMAAVRPAAELSARDHLARDRIGEFQRLARERGTLMAAAALGLASERSGAKAAKGSFMREFFARISEIQGIINAGRADVQLMGQVLEDSLQATTQEQQRETSDRLQSLVQGTNGHIANAKRGMEALKSRSDEEAVRRPNSAEARIRKNMQQAMARKHQQLLLDFQQAQVDYKKALQKRQQKEMELLMPDASAQERADMIEAGETTSLVVAKKMAGAHALLLDEVQRIRDKHQDILRLEASIRDLAQMFQEIAVLVEEQGELLDAIELNVNSAKTYTAQGERELITAKKTQRNTQKWMCCLTMSCMVLLVIVLIPVLLKFGG
uniref:t-SNARE coiled-coil homology domain-containing protein n=1 Tax=Zooxanthella nutricula TaxID=1333877 RepID=A0A6U6MN60_9DINO